MKACILRAANRDLWVRPRPGMEMFSLDRYLLRSIAAIWLALLCGPLDCGHSAVAAAGPDFERQIAPILIRNCLRCHNASDPAGGLDLTREKGH